MQNETTQSAIEPFMKLSQSNMELFKKYTLSPEVTSQAMNDVQKLFQQAQDSATKLAQSGAYTELMQGLMKNFSDFWTDFAYSAGNALRKGQAAAVHQTEVATNEVIDATQANVRRARNAA